MANDSAEDLYAKMLEMRMGHIEEMSRARSAAPYGRDCCPCATVCFSHIYTLIRSIPFISILAVVPTLIGAYYCYTTEDIIIGLFLQLDLPAQAKMGIEQIPYVLITVVIVDCVAALAAFPSAGPLREYCFGRQRRGCLGFFQTIAGPCIIFFLFLSLLLLFILFFAGVVIALPSVTLLLLAWGACKSGSTEIQEGLGTAFTHMINGTGTKYSGLAHGAVHAVCGHSHDSQHNNDVLTAASFFTLGVMLIAVGQCCQATLAMNSYSKVAMTEATLERADEGQKRIASD